MPFELLLILAAIAPLLIAAVPPLLRDELRARAECIVIGQIAKVTTEIVARGTDYEDTLYRIELVVRGSERGKFQTNATISLTTSQPAKRPRGWAGPQGQTETPIAGAAVRCYITGNATDG